jgi:hypothetical protein
MKKIYRALQFTFLFLAASMAPLFAFAQTPSSTHYQLEDSEFTAGGGLSTSTTYSSQDAAGGSGDASSSSATYKANPGTIGQSFPGVPATPTLSNTGGTMYNTLDFVIATGGNASDATYAIAISDDSFVTTNFIQSGYTVGSSPVWQTYAAWGGASGHRLVELKYNTAYKIKVKARYGAGSETGYSVVASASTVNPTLTVSISGVAASTVVASQTTNIATTATSVAFSSLQNGSIKIGAQQVVVSTNANAGYAVSIAQDHDLSKTNGSTISAVTAINSSPASWPSGITLARFGYHTTDATLCTGNASRFSLDNTFAAATSSPSEIACNTGPASNDTTYIVFKVEIASLQAAGNYQNNITYVTTAQY